MTAGKPKPTGGPPSGPEPQSLADFADAARRLSKDKFAATHGEAFLLHHGPIGALHPAARPMATMAREAANDTGRDLAVPAQMDFLVFPVRITGRSPFPNFVSVGRTPNNDIVINDVSISKFQAFFRHGDDGQLCVQDAGSTNGTFVGDQRVPERQQGAPVPVASGASLRFGTVKVTFLLAGALQDLVERGL